jgi:uncharacterized protein
VVVGARCCACPAAGAVAVAEPNVGTRVDFAARGVGTGPYRGTGRYCGTVRCARSVTTPIDLAAVERQLGRTPRAVLAVAHRCACGLPDVIESAPRLPDGSPFPTFYYLTCPRAAAAVGTLEAAGLMREMSARLQTDDALAAAYAAAHRDYLARRDAIERLPGDPGVGGMPTRVKCLHVLVAHSLAVGPGVNPLGDEALAMLPTWGNGGACVDVS